MFRKLNKFNSNFDTMLSELTAIISTLNLRNKPENKVEMLSIWKKIMRETRGSNKYTYESMFKLLLLFIYNEDMSPMDFITGCGFSDLQVKRLAYLGVMLTKKNCMCIMMINTLKKDLKNIESMNYALRYICNFGNRDSIFSELNAVNLMSPEMSSHYPKRLIAYYIINPLDNNIRLIDKSTKHLSLKLQIIIDNVNNKESTFVIYENDIRYLKKIFLQTKEINLKMYILKFLRVYSVDCELVLSSNFLNIIERTVGRALNESNYLVMALSLEAVKLILTYFPDNQISNKLTLHLLGSNKDFYNISALSIVKKYRIQISIVINFFIDKGLGKMENLQYLISLIEKDTAEYVYSQFGKLKIRMIRYKSCKGFDEEIVCKNIIEKIFSVSSEELRLQIMKVHYTYLKEIKIRDSFSMDNTKKLFKEFSQIDDINAFNAVYQMIDILDVEDPYFIHQMHLKVILNKVKFNIKLEPDTVQKLIDSMLLHGNLLENYELLLIEQSKLKDEFQEIREAVSFFSKIFHKMNYLQERDKYVWYYPNHTNEFKKGYHIEVNTRSGLDLRETDRYVIASKKIDGMRKVFDIELIDFEDDKLRIEFMSESEIMSFEILC